MISITEKTLQDLEFNTVLETIASRCNTDIGEAKAMEITPFKNKEELLIVSSCRFALPTTSRALCRLGIRIPSDDNRC